MSAAARTILERWVERDAPACPACRRPISELVAGANGHPACGACRAEIQVALDADPGVVAGWLALLVVSSMGIGFALLILLVSIGLRIPADGMWTVTWLAVPILITHARFLWLSAARRQRVQGWSGWRTWAVVAGLGLHQIGTMVVAGIQ